MHTLSLTNTQMNIIRAALEAYLIQETEYYTTNFESFVATIKLTPKEKDFGHHMESFIRDGHRLESMKDLLRALPNNRRSYEARHDVEM